MYKQAQIGGIPAPAPNVARNVSEIITRSKMGLGPPQTPTQQFAGMPNRTPQNQPPPEDPPEEEELDIHAIIADRPSKKIVREYFKERVQQLEEAAEEI